MELIVEGETSTSAGIGSAMGKILDFGYQSPNSQRIADLAINKPAAVKARAAVAPKPVLERREVTGQADATPKRAAVKPRKVAVSSTEPAPTHLRESRVSHATKKDPTAAVRRARWRKKNPEQHADQQRAARARRKEKV